MDGSLAMFPQHRQNRIIAPLDIQQDQTQKFSLRKKICYFLKVSSFFVALISFFIGLGFVYHTAGEQEGKHFIYLAHFVFNQMKNKFKSVGMPIPWQFSFLGDSGNSNHRGMGRGEIAEDLKDWVPWVPLGILSYQTTIQSKNELMTL